MADEITYNFTEVSIFFWIWLFLTTPAYVYATILFWKQRRAFPIRGRQPTLVVLSAVTTILYSVFTCLKMMIANYSCTLASLVALICVYILGTLYFLRAFTLMFAFELAIAQIAEDDEWAKQRRVSNVEVVDAFNSFEPSSIGDSDLLSADGDVSVSSMQKSTSSASLYASMNLKSRESMSRSVVPSDPSSMDDMVVENMQDPPHRWFLTHKHYIQAGFMARMIAIATVVMMLCIMFILIFAPAPDDSNIADCRWPESLFFLGSVVLILVGGCLVLGYRLREISDGFAIKHELFSCGICCAMGLIVWIIFRTAARSTSLSVFPFQNLGVLLVMLGLMYASVISPLKRSYEKHELAPNRTPQTFQELLHDPDTQRLFKEFLLTEFSVENLLFWNAVEEFRKESIKLQKQLDEIQKALNKQSRKAQRMLLENHIPGLALDIYKTYVNEDAALQVNLPFIVRDKLDQLFAPLMSSSASGRSKRGHRRHKTFSNNITETTFDTAQRVISELMETDSFPRFVESLSYQSYLADNADKEVRAVLHAKYLDSHDELGRISISRMNSTSKPPLPKSAEDGPDERRETAHDVV